jgi:tagatose-6-phosphate ketose/aldose isomerase
MNLLPMDEASLERSGAAWTAREIAQQPSSLIATHAICAAHATEIAAFLDPLITRRELRILLTGAGSSAFIGESLAPTLSSLVRGRVEAIPTTDLLSGPAQYFDPDAPTLLVSFARSGDSPESVAVVDLAERLVRECHHLVFTCNEAGALYRRCGSAKRALAVLTPRETNDQSFAMTSSFSAMMLAARLAFDRSLDTAAVHITSRAVRGVLDSHNAYFQALAREPYTRVVYLGSNGFKGIAREGALKLLEMTDGACAAISDSPLGFRHGPKTFIAPDTLVFVMLSSDPYTRRYDLDLLHELRSEGRAARIVALTPPARDAAAEGDCVTIEDASLPGDANLSIPYLVCAQLYALHRSLFLGNSPDQPSKSQTVSRVVRGVTIHPY